MDGWREKNCGGENEEGAATTTMETKKSRKERCREKREGVIKERGDGEERGRIYNGEEVMREE